MKNAIELADGNLESALELLLHGMESPFSHVSDDRRSTDSGDVQIVHQQHLAGSKRPRSAPDASTAVDSNGGSADEVHGIGHVFVDDSNMNVHEQEIPALDFIACRGLASYHERVVVGSQTEAIGRGRKERAWQALGYSAHFQHKQSSNQPESFVDEMLVAHVQRVLLQHSPEGRTIVLLTGECCSIAALCCSDRDGVQVMAMATMAGRAFWKQWLRRCGGGGMSKWFADRTSTKRTNGYKKKTKSS